MFEIIMPFKVEGLILRPEFSGRVRLSDDMQQTLASLVGFDGIARRLLRSSKDGVLYQTTPRLANIVHITGDGINDTWTGSDLPITEVMIMCHPDNSDWIYVTPDKTAAANNSWPLKPSEVVSFTLDNLNNLNLFFPTIDNTAIIAYTR